MEKPTQILIVAGEASGDHHAAALIRQLKTLTPHAQFFGLGGDEMQREGVRLQANIVKMAVIGFTEVVRHFKQLHGIFHALLAEVERIKPAAAILVDYPGFNLRLAEQLHRRNIPVIYYISPQLWAWGAGRIRLIKRIVDLMIVLFPFEETLYRKNGIPVTFVGHPLLEQVDERLRTVKPVFPAAGDNTLQICLLPGSRMKEVKTLLPIMLQTAALLHKRYPGRIRFHVLAAPTVPRHFFEDHIRYAGVPAVIADGMDYATLRSSTFALVCSGTATLETALIGTPLAVLYTVNFLTWLLVRMLIRIPYIGLVNVVRGKRIAEEFIQFRARPEIIADHVATMIDHPDALRTLKNELATVRRMMGESGASQRAAKRIAAFLAARQNTAGHNNGR